MFRFQNPNLQNDDSQPSNRPLQQDKLNLDAGQTLQEISDVDSIHSLSDTEGDELDSDHTKRIRAKVSSEIMLPRIPNVKKAHLDNIVV